MQRLGCAQAKGGRGPKGAAGIVQARKQSGHGKDWLSNGEDGTRPGLAQRLRGYDKGWRGGEGRRWQCHGNGAPSCHPTVSSPLPVTAVALSPGTSVSVRRR